MNFKRHTVILGSVYNLGNRLVILKSRNINIKRFDFEKYSDEQLMIDIMLKYFSLTKETISIRIEMHV